MNPRCKICIDPSCEGRMDCDCENCEKVSKCYRIIRPTIRITRKCTQSCEHCCFSCSPRATDHMTAEMAGTIAKFFKANDIFYANIMGGEFWLCEDWVSILGTLVGPLQLVRIVTNGDWAKDKKTSRAVVDFFETHPVCHLAITKDHWHTNTNIEDRLEGDFHCAFKKFGLLFNKTFIGSCRRCAQAFAKSKMRGNRHVAV